jgi:hypothetical protein
MKHQESNSKKVSTQEAGMRLSFDTLSQAYLKSYDSKKPTLLKEIDRILDQYLTVSEMQDTTIITKNDLGIEDVCEIIEEEE